jgi:hypothetical protein
MAIIILNLSGPFQLRLEECEQDLYLAECQHKAACDTPWHGVEE